MYGEQMCWVYAVLFITSCEVCSLYWAFQYYKATMNKWKIPTFSKFYASTFNKIYHNGPIGQLHTLIIFFIQKLLLKQHTALLGFLHKLLAQISEFLFQDFKLAAEKNLVMSSCSGWLEPKLGSTMRYHEYGSGVYVTHAQLLYSLIILY